jgi:hypothetical protein
MISHLQRCRNSPTSSPLFLYLTASYVNRRFCPNQIAGLLCRLTSRSTRFVVHLPLVGAPLDDPGALLIDVCTDNSSCGDLVPRVSPRPHFRRHGYRLPTGRSSTGRQFPWPWSDQVFRRRIQHGRHLFVPSLETRDVESRLCRWSTWLGGGSPVLYTARRMESERQTQRKREGSKECSKGPMIGMLLTGRVAERPKDPEQAVTR